MTRMRMLVGAGLGLMVLGGCASERTVEGYDENVYVDDVPLSDVAAPDFAGMGDVEISGSRLSGTVGDVAADNDGLSSGYSDSGYTTIYTNVDEAQNGAVMTILDVMGGLDHADFQPGARVVYRADAFNDVDEGESFVSVIGCSGDDPGNWAFDQTADVVSINVDEGPTPDVLVFTYTARFETNADSVVTGTFETPR